MTTDASTTEEGSVIAHSVLDEPDRRFFGSDSRRVPDSLVPSPEQALVLRTASSLVALDWGQVPDPSNPDWLKARSATLVRRQWSETLSLRVPSQSPDRSFEVRTTLRATLTSAETYLSAETASSAVYRDNIGTMARDLGKDFDARSSVEYETALRARLTAWIRVRRSEIPGVEMELGIVEVAPPETAIKAHADTTNALWQEQYDTTARDIAQRSARATHEHERIVEELRSELDEVKARLEHTGRLVAASREEDLTVQANDAAARRAMAGRHRRARESEVDHGMRMVQGVRDAEYGMQSRQTELDRLDDEKGLEAARLEIEAKRREIEQKARMADAKEIAALLASPQGAAAFGLATGKVEPGQVLAAHINATKASESKFYALLVYLIEHDQRGELDLGESAKELIMHEMRRLSESMDRVPGERPPTADLPAPEVLDASSKLAKADPFDG